LKSYSTGKRDQSGNYIIGYYCVSYKKLDIKNTGLTFFAGTGPRPPICAGAHKKQKDRKRLPYFPSS